MATQLACVLAGGGRVESAMTSVLVSSTLSLRLLFPGFAFSAAARQLQLQWETRVSQEAHGELELPAARRRKTAAHNRCDVFCVQTFENSV